MSLPLQKLATEDGLLYLLTPSSPGRSKTREAGSPLLPAAPPGPGEQYRFHFDMTKCIGCRCCEVACNEQNNNPADIRWRRVGEIEAGSYPFTQRFYLSMGCNHCVEPSCLKGCPVDAFKKDGATGLVLHSADVCIGCQYCTWNCAYGVPQYNPERGVVGKCDMCYGRLSEGREPACVNACPEGAIQIETVNTAEWLEQYRESANAPGLPPADETISTTRVTVPTRAPVEFQKADSHRVRPEQPHWSLVLMTVLTQLAVGALWALTGVTQPAQFRWAPAAALAIGCLSLAAATFHLGRPIYAYRALRMWRRSWLSREVLLFAAFAFAAYAYACLLWWKAPAAAPVGALAALLGAGGVTASAYIYLVPARPAWNSKYTVVDFYCTALLLGPLFLKVFDAGDSRLWMFAAAGAAGQLLNQALKFLWLIRSDDFELRASARLLSSELQPAFLARFVLLGLGGILLPSLGLFQAALGAALAAEIAGRYLFFVSVVPKNIALSFAAGKAAA